MYIDMFVHRRHRNAMRGGMVSPVKWASNLVNKFVEKSPFEMHLPGYQFAGPGTKFFQREAAGQRGINKLDNGAYWHDKAYVTYGPGVQRAEADKNLYDVSQSVIADPSQPPMERFWAKTVVSPAMKFQMMQNAKHGLPMSGAQEMSGGSLRSRSLAGARSLQTERRRPIVMW